MKIITHKLNSKVRGVIRPAPQLANQAEEPEIIIPIDPDDPMIPEEFPEPEAAIVPQ